MSTDPPEMYEKLWISDFFHSFPHINFNFKEVNSTFEPDSNDYKQALGFWALVPVAVCFLLWLVFLIYFICRCCHKQRNVKQQPSSCPNVVTGLLILVGIALVGVGFFGNENVHRGVSDARHTILEVNTMLTTASHRVETLGDLATDVSTRLSDALEKAAANITDAAARKKAISLITEIRQDAQGVSGYLGKIQVEEAIHNLDFIIDTLEYYRWMITIVIYCVYIFIFLLSVIGLLLRSKGTLIISAVVAVFCSLFIWLATGAYIGTSVALGDLCVDPDGYAIRLADPPSVRDTVEAYVKCTDPAQPYQADIISAQTAVSQAISALNETVKLAQPYNITGMDKFALEMNNDLQFAIGNLSTLLNNVGMCTNLHHYYVSGVNSACTDTISAVALLTLVSCLVGTVCTVIIFCLSCVWRQYSKQRLRSEYLSVDDTDPFLPRPPPYETDYGTIGQASPRPWSERGALQHSSITSDDQVMALTYHHPLPLDESPPPAYHSGRFVQQYAESAPTPANMRPYSAK